MKDIKNYLVEKGWKKSDINKTIKIIEKAKKNKHPQIKSLDKLVYWFSLLITIIGNLVISISLIPVLLILKGPQLYLVIIILGFAFGLLFELLLRGIENLETKHHLFLGIIIPIIAVTNFIIISKNIKTFIGLENPQDPIIVGSVYAIAFIIPYISYQIFLKEKY
ncbi:MAG: hypothetical protein QF655_02575 [Candidatus Woesearchaeota archaeon]|jgi:uncharacterized membrane protein|nr:hypothetical protein [Candidatus Woesearchaeota archaeon]MDP6265249.1 hypothetical protein [Candidatus Woesearchaeota archaeon]MDP7322797.1 hypothetical protein [Candidatus Woesearchaeota archaeon]MDP7476488.1 hypothetical protein [Candidatus Woesearchaeota archaeon]HJO01406.1 hypothetical protein [Candidatus Woesearchaeota archaeon]|tara:strand:+ start:2250 stop:2744 length:495 start_codon:yes stop_codon:yes gene_type:complete